ncbi:MAG: NfeD family protein [Anaerolineae bacterium]
MRGELWVAVSDQPLPAGERVKVVGFQGIKAVVKRLGTDRSESGEALYEH